MASRGQLPQENVELHAIMRNCAKEGQLWTRPLQELYLYGGQSYFCCLIPSFVAAVDEKCSESQSQIQFRGWFYKLQGDFSLASVTQTLSEYYALNNP